MSYNTVQVSNLSPNTTQQQLHDFFTFCGKILNIDLHKNNEATITFEKPSAAKTAFMLNGGTLDNATISVTSEAADTDEQQRDTSDGPIDQSDKPRAGIAAEILAKGYSLSDKILERAIALDKKQGISARFLAYIHAIDSKIGESAIGENQTLSGKAQEEFKLQREQAHKKGYDAKFSEYYNRALSSKLGGKVKEFYTSTEKEIRAIHEEARRIADQGKLQKTESTAGQSHGTEIPATQ